MKLSKEELKKKISEKVTDEDLSIELLEDIEDSMDVVNESESEEIAKLKSEIESKDVEISDLKKKYKERFLNGSESDEENNDNESDGLKEEEIIEKSDIFEEVE